MASELKMVAPICLVENIKEEMIVNKKAIEILEKISQPVLAVAIVGLYRTGKSYLMNRLAGQNHGFPLGSTVQSKTKGIWMWCMPHPTKPDNTLVLLDTEGLGDVEKGDPKTDSWIFALAVLLSSTFIYNSMGTINHQALAQLHYVTELTELIKAKSSYNSDGVQDSTEFVSFFPDFIWTVRDFTLELKMGDSFITADQYLENALKLIPGENPNAQASNYTRECIRKFFPSRKCFVFDRPTNDISLLSNIENITEGQLDPKFLEQTKSFCSYVFTREKIKTLREGIVVTGNRLGALVETYMKAINSGAVPCLENAVTTLAQRENAAAVQKAADHYSEQMAQRVRLPTDTLQELLDVHAACEKEAIAVFMERSFKDEDLEFQKKLVKIIQMKKEDFSLKNEKESDQYCQEKLNLLSKALMENISAGTFCVPGGYQIYMETRKKIEEDYCQVPRKGVKAAEVFQRFLQSAAIEDSIMQSDRALTDGEKAMAAEMAKKETAEKEQELLRQKVQEQEQNLAAQKRTLRENTEQSAKKLKLEKENILREQEKILDQQLKIQKDLLEEGLKKKSEAMNAEIKHLKNRLKAIESSYEPFMTRALNSVGDGISAVLCAPVPCFITLAHSTVTSGELARRTLPNLGRAHRTRAKGLYCTAAQRSHQTLEASEAQKHRESSAEEGNQTTQPKREPVAGSGWWQKQPNRPADSSALAHVVIRKERGLLTSCQSPIKLGSEIINFLEAVHLPREVAVVHCNGHQASTDPLSQVVRTPASPPCASPWLHTWWPGNSGSPQPPGAVKREQRSDQSGQGQRWHWIKQVQEPRRNKSWKQVWGRALRSAFGLIVPFKGFIRCELGPHCEDIEGNNFLEFLYGDVLLTLLSRYATARTVAPSIKVRAVHCFHLTTAASSDSIQHTRTSRSDAQLSLRSWSWSI
ncbi:LOW QUALITY PROTEIN: guanylate-binding protein 6-like [Erethizon dorsatum]